MKLRTKLIAICAGLLLLGSAALSGAMLWQVREQSYRNLSQRSGETMTALVNAFEEVVIKNVSGAETPVAQRTLLRYCFRSCEVDGSVLAAMGELLSAPTRIDPRAYLDVGESNEVQSVRCRADGRNYLILGRNLELPQGSCQVYLVSDASFIRRELRELLVRFLLLALGICGLGLIGVRWLIVRTLAPLSQLQITADRIAAGNYAQRVSVVSPDEVGLLAENFNRMAAAVESHVETLTEQNARQQLFIGSVTHEFKTPLTSLLLNVDTLRTVYLPEERREELLESMNSQLHWLEQLVHKLLSLMSLNKSAQIRPSSLPELLEQVRNRTKPVMKKYGTVLEIFCNANTLPMDPDLICSALVNLIENSAKASSPGQSIRLLAEGNVLEVSDSGRGIPQKDLGRVTEPFYMGDPSRSKRNGGFGLGLALVKEIAAVHAAALDLQSIPGKGTVVRLTFPTEGNGAVTEP